MTVNLDPTNIGTRGDDPSEAGRNLRGILQHRRRYDLTRKVLIALTAVLAIAGFAGLGIGLFVEHGVKASMSILGLVVIAALAGKFTAATQGASLGLLSAAGAAIASVTLAHGQGAPSWIPVVAVLAILFTGIVAGARSTRLPVLLTSLSCHWVIVIAVAVSGWVAGISVIVAAVAAVGVVLLECNIQGWWTYREARRRSSIPVRVVTPDRAKIGMHMPPLMASENVERGLIAEEETARELDDLGPEYVVLHSRKIPRTNADLDHLVIGPHGVALVDSKYRSGEMTFRERAVTLREHAAPDAADLFAAATDADELAAELAPAGVPDEFLSEEGRAARRDAYEANVVSVWGQEGQATTEPWWEWYLNGRPISATLASSTVFELQSVETALEVPAEQKLPCLLSIVGARMTPEYGDIPVFDENGFERLVEVVNYRSLTARIRNLPEKVHSTQMVTDLAIVVDYLFPKA